MVEDFFMDSNCIAILGGTFNPVHCGHVEIADCARKQYPDILYQYRPEWLGRQSLDLYIPSLCTAIEYQGIQHYLPIEFFGGEEALALRQELDQTKKLLCTENHVRLIEWPYDKEPSDKNIREMLS